MEDNLDAAQADLLRKILAADDSNVGLRFWFSGAKALTHPSGWQVEVREGDIAELEAQGMLRRLPDGDPRNAGYAVTTKARRWLRGSAVDEASRARRGNWIPVGHEAEVRRLIAQFVELLAEDQNADDELRDDGRWLAEQARDQLARPPEHRVLAVGRQVIHGLDLLQDKVAPWQPTIIALLVAFGWHVG
ncbi:MAG: hypothetical protein J2P57_05800 [Acidimicrobiaceae bacterium]|nr:hypothetical protein [Acidimicrobiaceae bacterium]